MHSAYEAAKCKTTRVSARIHSPAALCPPNSPHSPETHLQTPIPGFPIISDLVVLLHDEIADVQRFEIAGCAKSRLTSSNDEGIEMRGEVRSRGEGDWAEGGDSIRDIRHG